MGDVGKWEGMMEKKDVPVLPQGGVGHLREMGEHFGLVEVCCHDWAFLRTSQENVYFDKQGERIGSGPTWYRQEALDVDVFYCRHCLEYRKVSKVGIDGEN